MADAKNFLNDWLEAHKHTSSYKDTLIMEVMTNREKFEENLNEMWSRVPHVGMSQMMEYKKAVDRMKSAGLKVLRNPAGKHKIVYK